MSDLIGTALNEAEAAVRNIRTFVAIETPYAAATLIELDRVHGVIKRALATHPEADEAPVVDLAAALRASVDDAKVRRLHALREMGAGQ